MKNFENSTLFSQKIKLIRAEHRLTQREMAQKLGISVNTLSKIEKGILPPRLSCSVIFRIQQQFGISPKDLFTPTTSR